MEVAAKINNLNKDFLVGDENVRILHNITIDIRMGELTMLVGPSGCGKTTLISIISGILSPTSGSINLLGYNLNKMTDRDKVIFRRQHIGFIFQQYNLLPALTAAENAAMPLLAANVPQPDAVDRARELLNQIDMQGHTEKLPRHLSGGQQQRVAIARALVHHPNLIVCDEPTAALDAKTGHGVMEILANIAKDKARAVLIVTHDNRIYNFADRILEMSDGHLIGDHKPQNFIHQD